MKIIKEFIDYDVGNTEYSCDPKVRWFWGLGEDGELYCKKIYD